MLLISFLSTYKTRFLKKGFGLIELMVSISIMVLIMAVVLTRQESFNGSVLLRSQAYEVALQLREIQLNAVSATGISGNYRTMLGINFDTTNKSNYKIFRDADVDAVIDSGELFGEQGVLDKRFEIRAIRANGAARSNITVIFERPDFDARFHDNLGNLIPASYVEIDVARVGQVGAGVNVLRTVEITSTGQIRVI